MVTLRDPFEFMLSYKYTRGMSAQDAQMLEALYHPLACATVYRTYAREAKRLVRELPDQVLPIYLEEVRKDPDNQCPQGKANFFKREGFMVEVVFCLSHSRDLV